MNLPEMSEPRGKVREQLPRRLRPIFDRLTEHLLFDRTSLRGYRTLHRIAGFLCEIEKRAGTRTIKAAMRACERIDAMMDEQMKD